MSGKIFDLAGKRIYVAGHHGMVGSAIVRRLAGAPCELITVERGQVDLERQVQTEDFLATTRPDVVIVAAGRVGGIYANNAYPAQFISENLAIARNTIEASYKTGVQKLLFLGSSCIYPRPAEQPMREDELLRGPLEPTNQWYAVAKIAGIKLCQAYRRQYGVDFISIMPTNVYGPGDNYHPENSHVVAALIRRFHESKQNGRCGGPANRVANFCSWMISPTPACSFSRTIRANSTSTWAAARRSRSRNLPRWSPTSSIIAASWCSILRVPMGCRASFSIAPNLLPWDGERAPRCALASSRPIRHS